jgi:integrase
MLRTVTEDDQPGGHIQLRQGCCRMLRGLGDVRFHDLRHAYASRLLEGGVHPKVVSEALGHSSISITMDTYSHVMPSMSQVAADAIDAVLGE